jgi:hypothetical protein
LREANKYYQDLVKNFANAGFTPQVKPLAEFQESYGLEGEEDDEDIEMEGSGSEEDDDSESGDEMEV